MNQFSFLQSELTGNHLPWYFVRNTAIPLDYNSEDNFSFSHTVYDIDFFDRLPSTPLFALCHNALLACLDNYGAEIDSLYRIRLNLYTKHHEEMIHEPHVDDHIRSMKIGILYITTNLNSPTIFYNELYQPGIDTNTIDDLSNKQFTVKNKIQSVENNFVLFDSNIYHSSTRPTQEAVRININYNFTIK